MNRITRAALMALIIAGTMLVTAAAVRANPRNTLQPSNVYFGRVHAGQHPERVVTVANHTGSPKVITRFLIAGSGGGKFTLVRSGLGTTATCRLGMRLRSRATCTIIVRVKTTVPEFWQAVIDVFYRAPLGSVMGSRGVWNGAVYADVV